MHLRTMRAAYKGVVGPQCRGCIQRKRMGGYFCETSGCGYPRPQLLPTLNLRAIEQAHGAQFAGHAIPYHSIADPIKRREKTFDAVVGGGRNLQPAESQHGLALPKRFPNREELYFFNLAHHCQAIPLQRSLQQSDSCGVICLLLGHPQLSQR